MKVQGRIYERNYSLTERDNTLVLTVKKVADGIVSRRLVEDSQVGQVIELVNLLVTCLYLLSHAW